MATLVTVQIVGTAKNAATRKAVRFFKERGVQVHLVDLRERPLKPRELENIAKGLDPAELIDREGSEFKRLALGYLEYDPFEQLLETPLIMKMPVVRMGTRVAIGEDESRWREWLSS